MRNIGFTKKTKSDEEQDFESKLKEDLLASQEHIKAIGGDLILNTMIYIK